MVKIKPKDGVEREINNTIYKMFAAFYNDEFDNTESTFVDIHSEILDINIECAKLCESCGFVPPDF